MITSLTIIQIGPSGVPPKTIKNSAVFDCLGVVFDCLGAVFDENEGETIENGAEMIENGAETKHLNSTRTARPPKGPGSSSRIQMLKSSPIYISTKTTDDDDGGDDDEEFFENFLSVSFARISFQK